MPTVERRSLPQSLSIVASKGRRFFARETHTSTEWSSKSPTPLRASALNLNEALEQCWSAASSPYCLSSQLQSPQPSLSAQPASWGKDFGRRRSSNTTATSSSSVSAGTEVHAPQRRHKSLFSKKARSEHLSTALMETDTQKPETHFVDPFAREVQRSLVIRASLKASSHAVHSPSNSAAKLTRNRSTQRLSAQQQQQQQQQQHWNRKKEALDRISDLVCLSAENQMQVPRSLIGASSPTFLSPSPSLYDNYFYPIEAPPSPTSPLDSARGSISMVTFPLQTPAAGGGLRLTATSDAETNGDLSSVKSPSLSTISTKADLSQNLHLDASEMETYDVDSQGACWLKPSTQGTKIGHNQILLPSCMKRLPRRTVELDASKRSSNSLRADVGHDFEANSSVETSASSSCNGQHQSDWFRETRPSLRPSPPLRPSRSPLRSRSLSLNAATAKTSKGYKPRSSSPPPPLPSPPIESPPLPKSMSGATGLVAAYNLTPVHTPPRSRRTSCDLRSRRDSWASATSSGSTQDAPFHTPTFGSTRWTTIPQSPGMGVASVGGRLS